MCNLYAITKNQAAIRETFRAMVDRTGNLPSLPAVFPDQMAPVVRQGADGRELAMLRWGFPSPIGVPGKPAIPHWFALSADRPLFAFAGLWRPWTGTRGKTEGEHELFAFLTTEANAVVRPIHLKAMPVLLTTPDECEAWLTAPVLEALKLQRPLPDGRLTVVAKGSRQDEQPGGDFAGSHPPRTAGIAVLPP